MSEKGPINVRRKEVMPQVREEVQRYRSDLIESIRAGENILQLPGLEIRLAKAFGFCDGVQRAIEIAYAACHVMKGKRIWLIGEIIHNPEVNARLEALGLLHLPWNIDGEGYEHLDAQDVVIIPAFGVSVKLRRLLEERGVQLVDSTCGNVIKVWQRVRSYARRGITSIIHGKSHHEESMATASHSRGEDGKGRFLIIYSEEDARTVANYITHGGDRETFLTHFAGCYSPGFDPDADLLEIGMANQTTMLKGETTRFQQMLRDAVQQRDGSTERFHAFDTICGATQDRQQALLDLLEEKPDCVFIIGGYNSSNTSHLAQIAARQLPTYFVRDSACLPDLLHVRGFNINTRTEEDIPLQDVARDFSRTWRIGLTAGASCPANIIEGVILRLAELRGAMSEGILLHR